MSTLLEKGRTGTTVDTEIIDMHGHLGLHLFGMPHATPDVLVENMNRIGVDSIIVSSMRTISPYARQGNTEVYEALTAHPGRILGYVILWPSSHDDVKSETEYWLDKGFTGIKLHSATAGMPNS